MRRNIATIATVAVALMAAPVLAEGAHKLRQYQVSTDMHTPNEASFTSKAAIVKFTGRTSKVTGTLQIDETNTTKASGAITVDVASLDTGIGLRNEHMQGTIEAKKYPTATFKLQKLSVPGNKLKANAITTGTVTGQMTLHGVTRTITAPVELTYLPQQDPNYRPGDWVEVNSSFKLKLSDYKIALPAPVLGVKVADELDINFTSMAKAL
ncbi:MAG: YceI family protein [Candidatus Sericytochromatia bacterium]